MSDDTNAYAASEARTTMPADAQVDEGHEPAGTPVRSLLFISYEESSSHNGLNTRMRGIARALAARGEHVEIASPLYGGRARVAVTSGGIRVHMIPVPDVLSTWRIPIVSRALSVICLTVCMVRQLRKSDTRFAWVQAEQIYPFLAAHLLARKWRAKVLLDDPSLLGLFVKEKLKRRRILRPLVRRVVEMFETLLFNRADCILCSSNRQAGEIARRVRGGMARVRRLGNGVDLAEFDVTSHGGTGNRIFFNCSLPYYQNAAALRNLLKVFSHFEEQGFRDYSALVVVNDAAAIPHDLVAAIGSNRKVRLLANQPSIVFLLQSCDFVLLPYEAGHTTTAGPRLKVFEALACGKIVLSTKEGLDEVVGCVDGTNVVVCSDWLDMARKTMALIQEGDSPRKRMIREEARRFVETEYSWTRLVNAYDGIMEASSVKCEV
ncbi:MAG: glycosyltransferase [Solirubrobacterales bacterium]